MVWKGHATHAHNSCTQHMHSQGAALPFPASSSSSTTTSFFSFCSCRRPCGLPATQAPRRKGRQEAQPHPSSGAVHWKPRERHPVRKKNTSPQHTRQVATSSAQHAVQDETHPLLQVGANGGLQPLPTQQKHKPPQPHCLRRGPHEREQSPPQIKLPFRWSATHKQSTLGCIA